MGLPTFRSFRIPRKRRENSSSSNDGEDLGPNQSEQPSKKAIKSATRTRHIFSLLSSFLFILAITFLILVEVGSTSANKAVVGSIYFLKLDVSAVIAETVPQATLINSIARTLGLHDFYQVGLWGYCQGYGEEITDCSKPRLLYWFNPVEIILSELLAGATIALPSKIIDALNLVRLASHWMFGLFMTGACCCFVSIFMAPISVYTRWATFPIAILTFVAALTTTAATIIATVMFIIFDKVVGGAEEEVNIKASLGNKMFAFMWIAAGCSIAAWLVQVSLCCCCASRRDVRKGKKVGSRKAWRMSNEGPPAMMREKTSSKGWFARKAK